MNYLKKPWRIPITIQNHGLGRFVPDKLYIRCMFKEQLGYWPNLRKPVTFSEKLQWLKLYDHNPLYTTMVDKYAVKNYVAQIIGEEYIIPTLGVWDSFDEIDFDMLPNQFVLKCTHDSGGLVICKDKFQFDKKKARDKIQKSLSTDYYLLGREWPYKNVPRRIIAEKYMEDSGTKELRDYKFFCFGGQVKCYKIDFDRIFEHHANYFDKEGNLIYAGEEVCPPVFDKKLNSSLNIKEMQKLAEKLAENLPFLRADFYDVDGKIYFGELTFFPASGFGKFEPEQFDYELGKWMTIPGLGGGNLNN